MAPIREKRASFKDSPDLVKQILKEGNDRAREEAGRTMEAVRAAITLYGS
jgi:hypothetical protein